MDRAVALVQAYLQVNGYFTVAEYPVLEAVSRDDWRAATDLDMLALRYPGAGRSESVGDASTLRGSTAYESDPELGVSAETTDMIVGEVKEGRAEFNSAVRDPKVLSAALQRFGCCKSEEAEQVTETLLRRGEVETSVGHRIRMIAFGARADGRKAPVERVITTGHIVEYLRTHLKRHWDAFRQAQFKNEALGFLAMLEKAERGRS